MENSQTFEKALQQYQTAYVDAGLGRQPATALDEPRRAILGELERLQTLNESESQEIANFSKTMASKRETARAAASGTKNLPTQRTSAQDELERVNRMTGEAAPPPDFKPVYWRLGAIAGLLVTILFVRAYRVPA